MTDEYDGDQLSSPATVGPYKNDFAAMAEPCPCDGCHLAAKCRAEKLLCERFNLYVAGAGRPRWRVAPRAPTHALYVTLLEREQRPISRARKLRTQRLFRRRRAHRGAPGLVI